MFDHLELNTLYTFITFAVFMQPTYLAADTDVMHLLALFFAKETHFHMAFGWSADQLTYLCSL